MPEKVNLQCTSMRDTQLKYVYNSKGTIAYFPYIFLFKDRDERMKRLNTFVNKVNMKSKANSLEHKLTVYDEGKMPRVKISPATITIAKFVRKLCYDFDEMIDITTKPLDDAPLNELPTSPKKTKTSHCRKYTADDCGSVDPNCTWNRLHGCVAAKNYHKGVVRYGPAKKA